MAKRETEKSALSGTLVILLLVVAVIFIASHGG